MSVIIDSVIPDRGSSTSGGRIVIQPSVGFLVASGIELGVDLSIGAAFGDLFTKTRTSFTLAPYLRFIMSGETVFPYLGFGAGPQIAGDATFLTITINLGLLVKLSHSIALDLGLRPSFAIGVGDTSGGTLFSMPIGALGIDAFF